LLVVGILEIGSARTLGLGCGQVDFGFRLRGGGGGGGVNLYLKGKRKKGRRSLGPHGSVKYPK